MKPSIKEQLKITIQYGDKSMVSIEPYSADNVISRIEHDSIAIAYNKYGAELSCSNLKTLNQVDLMSTLKNERIYLDSNKEGTKAITAILLICESIRKVMDRTDKIDVRGYAKVFSNNRIYYYFIFTKEVKHRQYERRYMEAYVDMDCGRVCLNVADSTV